MSNSNLDPRVLARLQKTVSFLQTQTRGARRIKLNKGQTITVRFLPAKLGTDNMWYAQIARHWLNKVPIVCPRLTGDDFGGDLEADCPVCLLAEELNDNRDKDISDFGWQVKANPQFMTYCLLLERDGVQLPMEEVVNPYEFLLNRSTWEELHGFYLAGGRRSKDSVLDYIKGNDFSVIRTAKGTRLDKLDSVPIFDQDAHFDATIKKIEAAMKNPRIQIPTPAQLEAFADKVQDAAVKLGRHRRDEDEEPRRRSSRSADEDEAPRSRRSYDDEAPRRRAQPEEDEEPRRRSRDEDQDEAPRSRHSDREEEPRSRRSDREEEQDEPPRRRATAREEEQEQEEEPPRRRATAREEEQDEPPRRSSKPKEEEEDDLDYGPSKTKARRNDDDPEEEGADKDPPQDEKPEAERPAEDDEPEVDPEVAASKRTTARIEQPRGKLTPTANKQRDLAKGGSVDDDEDDLPEEDKDAAPPAKEKEMPRKRRPADEDNGDAEPPPVERKGKMVDALASRISKLKKD